MYLDFLEKLNQYINSLGFDIPSRIGLLEEEESIALMPMPGGDEMLFNDGSRDKEFNYDINIKVNAKNGNRIKYALDTLNSLSLYLSELDSLPSGNGSYEYVETTVNSYPSHVTTDENQNVIYSISIASTIFIKKGVVY